MSSTTLATFAILCIALCVWMFCVGRDPRTWRLWWLDLFGLLDADTPREQRLSQEGHIRIMASILFLLLAALSVSCAFWAFDQVRDGLRRKTTVERQLNYLKREVDRMKGR